MRLWSVAPEALDRAGLVAAWREGLLAQSVLRKLAQPTAGRIGYSNHPQLARFKEHDTPLQAIADWLRTIYREAALRGYIFREELIALPWGQTKMPLSTGQFEFEQEWLRGKLRERDPARAVTNTPNPIFELHPGPVAVWEKACR